MSNYEQVKETLLQAVIENCSPVAHDVALEIAEEAMNHLDTIFYQDMRMSKSALNESLAVYLYSCMQKRGLV
jgi:hypothetical protein